MADDIKKKNLTWYISKKNSFSSLYLLQEPSLSSPLGQLNWSSSSEFFVGRLLIKLGHTDNPFLPSSHFLFSSTFRIDLDLTRLKL